MKQTLAVLCVALIVGGMGYAFGVVQGWYGKPEGSGAITEVPVAAHVLDQRMETRGQAAPRASSKQILFGDLHVHTTYSNDAFRMSLPMVQGEGAHPPADACDYARFCSALDFWSINDHAESLTPYLWDQTKESIRQCNAVAGSSDDPDVVAFLGWEWTQSGRTPDSHYGHKNVIFMETDEDKVPTRPIASASNKAFRDLPLRFRVLAPLYDPANRQRYYDYDYSVRQVTREATCAGRLAGHDLPTDCKEYAESPGALFSQLNAWGMDHIVIPHGNTWGIYTPAASTWDKQLPGGMNNFQSQILVEIFSGHGNSEEYRDWRAIEVAGDGKKSCPEPRPDYLPSCWRAGEIIHARCTGEGGRADDCDGRAAEARQLYVDEGLSGWLSVPGAAVVDWLDSGQCRDCYLPAFNYRPGGSAQYAQAIGNFEDPGPPKRFRFGFIASSDNHSARPGTGYKETSRGSSSDWWGYKDRKVQKRFSSGRGEPVARSRAPDMSKVGPFGALELERQASFFLTGGLVGVHSPGRQRSAIWGALKRKEVYGTSGERILLWFDLLNPGGGTDEGIAAMGSDVEMTVNPRFAVKAVGAFKQNPGCPEYSVNALTPERLKRLCRGECYNPSDQRKLITRIEVIRIRPQVEKGEAVGPLIEDAWRVFVCEEDSGGCVVEFEDPDFESMGRDTVYYVRAVQQAAPAINAANLRCQKDKDGQCLAVNPCYGDYRTGDGDDCRSMAEGKAWSSPIFVDFAGD